MERSLLSWLILAFPGVEERGSGVTVHNFPEVINYSDIFHETMKTSKAQLLGARGRKYVQSSAELAGIHHFEAEWCKARGMTPAASFNGGEQGSANSFEEPALWSGI